MNLTRSGGASRPRGTGGPRRATAWVIVLAVATAGCAGSSRRQTTTAAQYLAIAVPANHLLDEEVDGFTDHSRNDVAAADADLRAEAATEHHFDQQLARIAFPAEAGAIARQLIQANQRRIALTSYEAGSASLAALRAFLGLHAAADEAVEAQVRRIRKALDLPPPDTS